MQAGVFIINKDKILLQKRSSTKKINPGKWCFVTGFVKENELPEDAVVRNLKEEIGLIYNKDNLKKVGIVELKEKDNTDTLELFIINSDIDNGELILNKDVCSSSKWFKISDVLENKVKDLGLYKEVLKKLRKYEVIDNLKYEKELYEKGITLIAGVDEVGRGPLIGPVVTAAVILPKGYKLKGLTDSKKLTEEKRNEFYKIIMEDAIAVSIGIKDNKVIDEVNIYEATKLAMYEAIGKLSVKPEHVLIDAMKLENLNIPSTSIIKGDLKSQTIAAASVIAKVTRDSMMYELGAKFPEYGFEKHKGYPTKEHIENVKKFGLLDNYRFTFHPISDLIKQGGNYEEEIRKTNI